MSKIKGIISQLQEEEYEGLTKQFSKTGAEKFLSLMRLYRANQLRDPQIKESLGVNDSAFYTLKSRLLDKIQDFLSNRFSTPNVDSIHKVEDIPELIYSTKRSKAIAILQKMEQDIQVHDSPYKLASVYDALKKLHMHSPKYYEYTQAYNRHIAYTIALDKAAELLLDFFRKMGEYEFSRNEMLLQVMSLLQQELYHVTKLYESHHLTVYRYLLDLSYLLFVPIKREVGDESCETMLEKLAEIFDKNALDKSYQHLRLAWHYMSFEYYSRNNMVKQAAEHYEAVNAKLQDFLLYNHCGYPSRFLLCKIERAIEAGTEHKLHDENTLLLKDYEPDRGDIPNYINYMIYRSASMFYAKKYPESAGVLVRLMNEVSFKNSSWLEIQIRLFLILCYIFENELDLAQMHLRSVARKIREMGGSGPYESGQALYKLLSYLSSPTQKIQSDKIKSLVEKYDEQNKNDFKIMRFLKQGSGLIELLERLKKKP
jgi:hypothetical protein